MSKSIPPRETLEYKKYMMKYFPNKYYSNPPVMSVNQTEQLALDYYNLYVTDKLRASLHFADVDVDSQELDKELKQLSQHLSDEIEEEERDIIFLSEEEVPLLRNQIIIPVTNKDTMTEICTSLYPCMRCLQAMVRQDRLGMTLNSDGHPVFPTLKTICEYTLKT